MTSLNSSLPEQNGRHFTDYIFKCSLMNESVCVSIWISLKVVPRGEIDINFSLDQVMAWHRTGDKPLPEQVKEKTPGGQ